MDDSASVYARFFDEASDQWHNDHEMNLIFLRCQQNYANDVLRLRGVLFLNEVYDMLGLPRTQEGQVVGWGKGETDEFTFIEFKQIASDSGEATSAIFLDFNVDGVVFDLLPKSEQYTLS